MNSSIGSQAGRPTITYEGKGSKGNRENTAVNRGEDVKRLRGKIKNEVWAVSLLSNYRTQEEGGGRESGINGKGVLWPTN